VECAAGWGAVYHRRQWVGRWLCAYLLAAGGTGGLYTDTPSASQEVKQVTLCNALAHAHGPVASAGAWPKKWRSLLSCGQ